MVQLQLLLLLLLVFSSGLQTARAQHYVDEDSLQTAVLNGYNANVRPDTTVSITIEVLPLSLNDLDISQQVMSFSAIYYQSWTDSRLTWTPSSYGNIESFVIPSEQLWTPPIVVENAVSNMGRIGGVFKDNTPVRVKYDGTVRWYPPLETTTSCEVKLSRYPFDTQSCAITLTVWGYAQTELAPFSLVFNWTYYSANGEWDLLDYWTSSSSFFDGDNPYTRSNIHLTYRRKWQFYSQNLILPIVLTSILTCSGFIVPVDSGEKIGYALTVLLSYVVFLTSVTDNLPSVSSDTSILQVYLAIVLCLSVLATILTCWVVLVHFRDPSSPVSPTMRVLVRRVLVPLRDVTRCTRRKTRRSKVSHLGKPSPGKDADLELNDCSARRRDDDDDDGDDDCVRKPPRPMAPESDRKEEEEAMPSWPEIAALFDNFFFMMYMVIKPLLTIIVLSVIYDGY
ncbi:5-hydroxytryptamine receptor 3A-like [Babylonia areolata]|uniref:5-hydroxytryptamine receptor 3A-like n=1 Tax=Babylonia areolata TaxID=304850 RepID=UPI003FD24DD4